MKQKIKIVIDSCSSLTKEEAEKRGIACVETTYMLDDCLHSAFDEENVSLVDFYKKLDEVKSCSTGCVNPSVFEECFEYWIKQGYEILYVGLSDKLSATYGNGVFAAEALNKKYGKKIVRTIDSKTGSFGTKILVDDAQRLIEEGKSLDEIEEMLNEYALKIVTTFVCRDLKFLHKCGRLSSFEAGLGKLLNIVPLIHVDPKDFKLHVSDKCLGKKLAYKTLRKKFIALINGRPCERVYLASCGLDEDVKDLKNYIIENSHIKDVEVGYIDKTMSCCCGPKTIAIFVR